MGLIVDTCVFILAERRKGIDIDALFSIKEPIGISAITLCELLVGVHLSSMKARADERLRMAEAIAAKVTVHDYR